MKNILVVGAGFSGAVVARELANSNLYKVTLVDERNHVAGNCHTERDQETNIMEHIYGPHIFNTNNQKVWQYIQQFGEFVPYINRVKAITNKGVFSLPLNLLTINQFFSKALSPKDAEIFISKQGDSSILEPKNFEEQALRLMGKNLYENFFKGYTIKQWGCSPKDLPASILSRLPIRFNYDDNYYNSKYQGIPKSGYTAVVQNILAHPNIEVKLNNRYDVSLNDKFDHIFYTGPLDSYFNYSHGRLGYRTIYFEKYIHQEEEYQGNAVINYCEEHIPHTRVHEHKHFTPWEKHDKSIYLKEFSKETGEEDVPFYPKRLANDKKLLSQYRKLGEKEAKTTFLGRLATYRYMDMHHVIDEALTISEEFLNWQSGSSLFKKFPNIEDQ